MSIETIWPLKAGQKSTGWNFLKNTLLMSDPKKLFYEKSDFLSFSLKLDKNHIQSLLPLCLRTNGEAIFFVVQHNSCAFGVAYKEAGLLIKVHTVFGTAYHFLWAVVDSEFGMHLGRDLLGVPKKMAQIEITDRTVGIRRMNSVNIQINFDAKEETENPQPLLGKRMVNVGGLGQFFLFQPIWTYRSPEEILSSRNITLDTTDFKFDGLEALVIGPPASGRIFCSNIFNSRTLLPTGFTGPQWLARNFDLRYR